MTIAKKSILALTGGGRKDFRLANDETFPLRWGNAHRVEMIKLQTPIYPADKSA
jgi:hypothetical protein